MELSRAEIFTLGAMSLVALAMPALLLPERVRQSEPAAPPPALAIGVPSEPSALSARTLFAGGTKPVQDVPSDAPELIGIAGRIGTDAVALVRGLDGRSRTLAVGDAVDGWRLESLAIDAAFFTRGTEQARMPLPAG